MIKVTVKDEAVKKMLEGLPKAALRAAEISIDKTGQKVKKEIREEMRRVFDNPTPYTLNSLQLTPTQNHNMQASVWFKDPDRMSQHYLVPQVKGGVRHLKGFERYSLDQQQYIPGKAAKLDRFGNVSRGQLRQVMSVLKVAEHHAGFQANITKRSMIRNKKSRDFVWIKDKRGKLYPGVYERVATGSTIAGKTARRVFGHQVRDEGRTRGRIIMARGLKAVLMRGRQNTPVKPLLRFYEITEDVAQKVMPDICRAELQRLLK